MSVRITLPPLANGAEGAKIARWLVKAGDSVKAGQPVVTISVPGMEIDVEAPVTGRLSTVRVETGKTAKIGDTLGDID